MPAGNGFAFDDLRSITTGWECTRRGIDVLPLNPCDPDQRPANYPRIWMAPSVLGLGEGATAALGATTALAFLAAVLAAIRSFPVRDAVVYAAVLCSPAVLLGIERGNADLLVFAVLVAGLVLLRQPGRIGPVLGHVCFLAAAVLKLFPVLAWGVLLRQPRRRVLVGLGSVALAFAAYALVTLDDIRTIREIVPQEILFSYGAGVLADEAGIDSLAVIAAGLLAALALVWAGRGRSSSPGAASAAAQRDLDAFWAGGGIFVGSFALFHSFNYRLIFLVLTVPQLLRWCREARAAVPAAALGLTLVLVSLWLSTSLSFYPFGLGDRWEDAATSFAYDEIVNSILFGYLVGALVLTRPMLRPGRETPAGRRADAYPPARSLPGRTSATP